MKWNAKQSNTPNRCFVYVEFRMPLEMMNEIRLIGAFIRLTISFDSISIIQKWIKKKNHNYAIRWMMCFFLCRFVVSGYHSISAAVRYVLYHILDQIRSDCVFFSHTVKSRATQQEDSNKIDRKRIQIDLAQTPPPAAITNKNMYMNGCEKGHLFRFVFLCVWS